MLPSQLSPLLLQTPPVFTPLETEWLPVVCVCHPIRLYLSTRSALILSVHGEGSYGVFYYSLYRAWNIAAIYVGWMKRSCVDNSLKNNPDLLFIQSVWGCHRADIHLEHVHSICCPGALWMCHLCEDITRAGGGILHTTSWPFKDSETMPHY